MQTALTSVPKQLLFQIVTAPGTEHAESHNLSGICCVPVRGVNNQQHYIDQSDFKKLL